MIQKYIVVLAPQPGGGWCAHFPDFPGCRAMGDRMDVAIENSCREVVSRLERVQVAPTPRSQEDVCADHAWARMRSIDWSTAVVSLVPISA